VYDVNDLTVDLLFNLRANKNRAILRESERERV